VRISSVGQQGACDWVLRDRWLPLTAVQWVKQELAGLRMRILGWRVGQGFAQSKEGLKAGFSEASGLGVLAADRTGIDKSV